MRVTLPVPPRSRLDTTLAPPRQRCATIAGPAMSRAAVQPQSIDCQDAFMQAVLRQVVVARPHRITPLSYPLGRGGKEARLEKGGIAALSLRDFRDHRDARAHSREGPDEWSSSIA